MGADTAMSVASEMVEDLSLSHDDARAIAAAIKQEIKQLTGQAPRFSAVDRSVLHTLQVEATVATISTIITGSQLWPGPTKTC